MVIAGFCHFSLIHGTLIMENGEFFDKNIVLAVNAKLYTDKKKIVTKTEFNLGIGCRDDSAAYFVRGRAHIVGQGIGINLN